METQERVINISELEELEKIVKDAQARIAELKAPTQLVTACTVNHLVYLSLVITTREKMRTLIKGITTERHGHISWN